jgi:hypothetical protein
MGVALVIREGKGGGLRNEVGGRQTRGRERIRWEH